MEGEEYWLLVTFKPARASKLYFCTFGLGGGTVMDPLYCKLYYVTNGEGATSLRSNNMEVDS